MLVALSVGLVGSTPGSDEPGAKVASYYDAHQARVFAAAFVLAAAAAFLVFFAVGLASALWPFSTARMLSEYVDRLYLPAVRTPVEA